MKSEAKEETTVTRTVFDPKHVCLAQGAENKSHPHPPTHLSTFYFGLGVLTARLRVRRSKDRNHYA